MAWTLLELFSAVTPWWAQRHIFLMGARSSVSTDEKVVLNACAYLLYVKEKKNNTKNHGSSMEGTNVQSVCISNAKSKNSAPFPCIFFFLLLSFFTAACKQFPSQAALSSVMWSLFQWFPCLQWLISFGQALGAKLFGVVVVMVEPLY